MSNSSTPTRVFGDKSLFAIEIGFCPDPDNDRWCGWDEAGTYGHFDLFLNGKSVFTFRLYDIEADDIRHKVLDTFTVHSDGRDDHLGPLFWWLEFVYDTITATSKRRFKQCGLMYSPYGWCGNIYPNVFLKRSGDEVIVWTTNQRDTFLYRRHVEYFVAERVKMDWHECASLIKEVLEFYYSQPSVKESEWFKEYKPGFLE